jgi:uncharacterized membrane protein YhiD involved in acid resistance
MNPDPADRALCSRKLNNNAPFQVDLGAGVIVRSEKGHHVHGLTTAACVWVTACVGAACAIAQWQIVVIGVVLVLILLVLADRSRERSIDAGRGDRAGLRISRRTERLRLARRCK